MLSAAALTLLGPAAAPAGAQETENASGQFGHYQEGARDILGLRTRYDPIEVETWQASAAYSPDDRLRLQLNFSQDTWSGATPVSTAPAPANANHDTVSGATPFLIAPNALFLDQASLSPLELDEFSAPTGNLDSRIVHTMSGASPEVRRQVDATLTRETASSALHARAGFSHEHDYDSVFGNVGGRWDFNRNATTLNAGLSYTTSDIDTLIKSDVAAFIYDACVQLCDPAASSIEVISPSGDRIIHGQRRDGAVTAGLTQVLDRHSLVEIGIGFTRSTGYLANPYKAVQALFVDPELQIFAPPGSHFASMAALLEQRPEQRNQGALNARFVHYLARPQAAAHLGYRYYQDDWGIRAHTLDADWAQPLGAGWTLTPRLRYYSQSAADFYTHYLVTFQSERPRTIDAARGQVYGDSGDPSGAQNYFDDAGVADPDGINPLTGAPVVDGDGVPVSQEIANRLFARRGPLDRALLARYYSSDHRLSAYGALSFGVTLAKRVTERLQLDLSYEHYLHAGDLRFGGGGEGGFADFDYDLVSLSLRLALPQGEAGAFAPLR